MPTLSPGARGAALSGFKTSMPIALSTFPFGLAYGVAAAASGLGAWLGASVTFGVAFYTSLAGGVLALALILRHRYGGQAARNLWLLLTHWRVAGITPVDALTLETSAGPKLPYALPITAGLALALWLW